MKDVKKQNGTDNKSKERKKIQWLYISIVFLAMAVLVTVFFLVPIDPGSKGSSSPKPPQMMKLAVKIGRLETEVHEKQKKLFDLLKVYNQNTGGTPPELKGLGLSHKKRKILEDRIIKEKDISIKSLIEDILDKDNEISSLKSKMAKYEASLPKPHITKEGETHYKIVMDFLVNKKKVEKEKALKLVEEVMLFEPLLLGFKVWNFYYNNEFSTFVTQGSAAISPTKLRKEPEKKQDDIRNEAIAEEEKLIARIKKLKAARDQLESRIDDLRKEKEEMEKKLNDLDKQNSEKERLLNSLFYMVDLEENLLKKGIIKKSEFLGLKLGSPKLKEISPDDFDQKIDLSKKDIIEIHANQFNLTEIKKVSLYPKFYEKDVDYKVEIEKDKKKAKVKILKTKKFRRDRVIISVE